MAINHVVLEGYLATKPQMSEPETLEFILRHHGVGGRIFGLFIVELWAGLSEPAFFHAKEGDSVIVAGHLIEGYRLDEETGESRSSVKIRAVAVKLLKVHRPLPHPPADIIDEFPSEEEVPF